MKRYKTCPKCKEKKLVKDKYSSYECYICLACGHYKEYNAQENTFGRLLNEAKHSETKTAQTI